MRSFNLVRNMSVKRFRSIALALFAGISIFLPSAASAKEKTDSVNTVETVTKNRESIFGGTRALDTSHFTWGIDAGASIDLTANDMSTFDVDILLGYKNKLIKTAGVGAGIHRTVQGGNNFIPLYAIFRTSFTTRPSILFFNARFGYSFSTIENSPTFGDYNAALGCGVNLSKSHRANTYLILSAAYRYYNERHKVYLPKLDVHYIWIAQLQFGVNF